VAKGTTYLYSTVSYREGQTGLFGRKNDLNPNLRVPLPDDSKAISFSVWASPVEERGLSKVSETYLEMHPDDAKPFILRR